ncbi:MAG TPA: RNA polymerase sigma-I factor [Clostridiales bacterium]|jgi:RNA polymerase sigma factor|nr:RNA polymerase sigma-I factor [Clostridiales bacterium]
MVSSKLQEEVLEVKKGSMDINIFIEKYQPFIFSTIKELKGRYIDESDELSTVGMLAFKEAVDSFDPAKGNFYSFAKKVIKLRLIDHYRKNKKRKEKVIPIFEDTEYKNKLSKIEQDQAFDQYLIEEETKLRREEIKEYVLELKEYDINLKELEKLSPRKKKLKEMYYNSADYIVEDEDLYKNFIETQRLPAKELSENLKINRKQLDRGRKYIISLIILKKGNYEMLSEYIKRR